MSEKIIGRDKSSCSTDRRARRSVAPGPYAGNSYQFLQYRSSDEGTGSQRARLFVAIRRVAREGSGIRGSGCDSLQPEGVWFLKGAREGILSTHFLSKNAIHFVLGTRTTSQASTNNLYCLNHHWIRVEREK